MVKEIIKEVTVTKQEIMYETSDGKLFASKISADKYEAIAEAKQQLSTLKSIVVPEINDRFLPYGVAYYINNIDDYTVLAHCEPLVRGAYLLNREYEGCGWYISVLEQFYDSEDELELIHVGAFILEKESELEKFQEAFQTPEPPQKTDYTVFLGFSKDAGKFVPTDNGSYKSNHK